MGRPKKVVAENSAESITKTPKTTKATKSKKEIVEIKGENLEFRVRSLQVPIIGISSLIVHNFGHKSWIQLIEGGKAKTELVQGGKKMKGLTPEEDFNESLYVMEDGKTLGFPAIGFKSAIVEAGYQMYKRPKTNTRSAIYVVPDGRDEKGDGLIKINGIPRMRQDVVRIGGMTKTAAPRFRAEFPEWSAVLNIQYVEGMITPKEVMQLVFAAGRMNGIGEWRPQKGGEHGMFSNVS